MGITDDTGEYRKEVLEHLQERQMLGKRMGEAERRISDVETDVKEITSDVTKMRILLLGDPDVNDLREGDRGGLVDMFRDGRADWKKCSQDLAKFSKQNRLVVVLIVLNVIRLFADIPAGLVKQILGRFL